MSDDYKMAKLPSNDSRAPLLRLQILPLITLLVLLIGITLRFQGLEQKLVWQDEVYTISRVFGYQYWEMFDGIYTDQITTPKELLRFQQAIPEHSFIDTWTAMKEHSEHGPLYYILATLATYAMPDTPLLAVRGTAVLLSLLLFPALFWCAWELFRDQRHAWITVALAATSPLHLLYAQEARQYALLTVLIAASTAALFRAIRYQYTGNWFIYSIILTLGLYTHLLFVQLFMAHALYLAWTAWQQPAIVSRSSLKYATAAAVAAIIAFGPWLIVMAHRAENIREFTAWMGQKLVSTEYLVHIWLGHLNRPFFDLPMAEHWWGTGAIIVSIVLLLGLYRAPRSVMWLFIALIIPTLFMLFLPDLLFGGVRSKEPRYLLQPIIGGQLVVAWAIAYYLKAPYAWQRYSAAWGLGALLSLGVVSQLAISQADSWWSKSISADNAALAQIINVTTRPLVLASRNRIDAGAGELISLSYRLVPTVSILAQRNDEIPSVASLYTKIFLLLPSLELQRALRAKGYSISEYSWKWYIATAPTPPQPSP